MPIMNFFKKLCGLKVDEPKRKKRTKRNKKTRKDKEKVSKLLVDSETSSSDDVILEETETDSSNSGGKGQGFQGFLIDSSSDTDDDKTKKRKKKKKKNGPVNTSKNKAKDGSAADNASFFNDTPSSSEANRKKSSKRNKDQNNTKSDKNAKDINPLTDSASTVSSTEKNNKRCWLCPKGSNVKLDSLKKTESLRTGPGENKTKGSNTENTIFKNMIIDSDSSVSPTKQKNKTNITDIVNFTKLLKDSDSSVSTTKQKNKKNNKDNVNFTNILKDSDSSATNQKSKKSSKDIMNFPNLLKDSDSSATNQKSKKSSKDIMNFPNLLKDSDSSATNQKSKKSSKDIMNFPNLLKDSDSSASATNQKTKKSNKDSKNFTNLLRDSDSSGSATNQKTKKKSKDNLKFPNILKDSDSSGSATKQKTKKSNKGSKNFTNLLKDTDSSASATNQKTKKSNTKANFFKSLLNDSDSTNSAERDKRTRETTGNDLNACDIHKLTYSESLIGGNNIKTASKDMKGNSENSNTDITLKDSESSANKIYSAADNNEKFQVDKPLSGTRSDEESKFRNNIIVNAAFGSNNLLDDSESSNDNETGETTQRDIKTTDYFQENNNVFNVQELPIPCYALKYLESSDGGKEIGQQEKDPRKADSVVDDNVAVNGSSMISSPLDDLNYKDKDYTISESDSNIDEHAVAPNLIKNSKSLESLQARKETERELNKSNDMIKNNDDVVDLLPPPHLLGQSELLHEKDDGKNLENNEMYTADHKKIYQGMDGGWPLFKELNISASDNYKEKTINDDLEVNVDLINVKQLKDLELSPVYFDRTADSRKIDYTSIISQQIHYSEPKLENKSTSDNSSNLREISETAERDNAAIEIDTEDVLEIEDNVDNSLKPPDLIDDSKPSHYNMNKEVISIEKEDERPGGNSPFVDGLETLPGHETPKSAVAEASCVKKTINDDNKIDSLEVLDVLECLESDNSYIFDKTSLLIDKQYISSKTFILLKGPESQNNDQTNIETFKESNIINSVRQNIFAVNHLSSQPLSDSTFSDSNKNDNGDTRVMSINKMHEVAGTINLLKESQLLDGNTFDRDTDKEYGIAASSNMFKNIIQNSFTAINDDGKNNQLNSSKYPDFLPKDINDLKPKNNIVEDEASTDKSSIKDDNLKEQLNQTNTTADEQEHSYVAKTVKDFQLLTNEKESQNQEDSDTELNLDDICERKYLKLTHSVVGNHTVRKSEKHDENSKNNNVIIIENFITPSAINNDQERDIAIENVDIKTANTLKNTESLINESDNTADENRKWKIFETIEDESPNNEEMDSCNEDSDEKVEDPLVDNELAANNLPEGLSPDNAGKEPDTKSGNVNGGSKSNEIIDVVISLSTLNNKEKDDNFIFNNSVIADIKPLKNTESLLKESNNNSNSNINEPLEDSSLLSGGTFILVSKSLPITLKSLQYDGVDKSTEAVSEKVETISNGNDNSMNWNCVDEKTGTDENSNTHFTVTQADSDSICTNDKERKIKEDMDEMCEFCGNYSAKDLKFLNHNKENIRIEIQSENDNVCTKSDNIVENFAVALRSNNDTEREVTLGNSGNDVKPLEDIFLRESDSTANKKLELYEAVQPIDSRSSNCSKKGRLKKDDSKNGNLDDKYSLIDLKTLLTNEIKKEMDKNLNDNRNIIFVNKHIMPLQLMDKTEFLGLDAHGIEFKEDDSSAMVDDGLIDDKNDGLNIETEKEAENGGKKEETNLEKSFSHSDENADDAGAPPENDVRSDPED